MTASTAKIEKGLFLRPFSILGVRGVWTNSPGFDKIAQRFWTTRTRRSGAKRRIRGVAANNPTLSAKNRKGPALRPFSIFGGAGCVDEPTRVRQNRAAILDDAHASVRSEAEDSRRSREQSHPLRQK